MSKIDQFEWLDPWSPIDDPKESEGLVGQLADEVCEGHALFGQKVKAIARQSGSDDVLFRLPDGRVADVHLVWQGRQSDPRWPATGIFPSLSVWADESMIPLHRALAEAERRYSERKKT